MLPSIPGDRQSHIWKSYCLYFATAERRQHADVPELGLLTMMMMMMVVVVMMMMMTIATTQINSGTTIFYGRQPPICKAIRMI